MAYEPPPEPVPLLRRRPAWAGGMTVLALFLAAALAGPVVLAGIALFAEIAAATDRDVPEPTRLP